jgi:hypothetical protein
VDAAATDSKAVYILQREPFWMILITQRSGYPALSEYCEVGIVNRERFCRKTGGG